MRRFELLEPRSLEEAISLLEQQPEAKVIAGGTALLILIKHGVYIPGTLINLKKVQGASEVSFDQQRGLRIGALSSIYEVESHPAVREQYPVLAEACHVVANIRIRNLATIGGNLAHADYQSDPPAVLLALGASVELTGSGGQRQVPLSEFLLGSYETTIEPGELLSAVLLPPPPADARSTYLKFTTRSSEDRPCAGIAAIVRRSNNGVIDEARLVVGAVSSTPIRVQAAEVLARGQSPSPELFEAMGRAASEAVEPIEDIRGPADYKRHVVGVLARRALAQCCA
jgi:carbon-monoxide dehydrogenase medium subunit